VISKNKILNLEVRRRIYDFIEKYPGLHFRDISRKLNIPKSTLDYHLKYLEKCNLISPKKEYLHTRFYLTDNIGADIKKILHFLRQESSRNIILYLVTYMSGTQAEISESLEKHPSTIKIQLKKLLDADIIELATIVNGVIQTDIKAKYAIRRTPITQEKIYILKNRLLLNKIITDNKNKLFDTNTKNIVDMLLYVYKDDLRKELSYDKKCLMRLNRFEKKMFDIFPHPYHV